MKPSVDIKVKSFSCYYDSRTTSKLNNKKSPINRCSFRSRLEDSLPIRQQISPFSVYLF